MSEEQNHFSLRKLSIGLASVLVGVSVFSVSQTVKADTVANSQASSVTSNVQSSNTQENKNVAKSTFSSDNQANNAKSDLIQTQENEQSSSSKQDQTASVSETQEANNNNDLGTEKSVAHTSSLQDLNTQSNTVTEKTAQHNALESGQKTQFFNLLKNSQKLNRKVLATNLIETNSSPTTNGGFDEATWGKLDVNDWQGSAQDGVYQLTGYTGDLSHVIVPNEADFEKAGKSTNGLQVGITNDTVQSLLLDREQTIAFSKTKGEKVKAIGTDWSHAFANSRLSKFDGSNLDVSDVTSMHYMFYNNKVSDLRSLAHWNTSNVNDMSWMFSRDSISDLSPLKNWNVSNVTNMSGMFTYNSISKLDPLVHWDTSKVTIMFSMFGENSINDLTPLAHWNTGKVINMSRMFSNNPNIKGLKPIADWNISSVSLWGFPSLFEGDTQLDLTNINDTKLMQGFLKIPLALQGTTFVTNNANLVKATINKDPTLTKTATRTIAFNIHHVTFKTINQVIYYKAIPTVRVNYDSGEIVNTSPVKASDWQLDDSKTKDAIVVNGQVYFKPVPIPHINGYKARIVRNSSNSMKLMVSFIAVSSKTEPSLPNEETPSKPSAPVDNPNNSAWTNLDHKVVDTLNQSDSGWTMPNTQPATYTVEVPADDSTIDLSDLVIAEPVHAQTRVKIRVTKRFKLSKKYSIKHLKHRKKAVRTFRKYRL